MPLVLGPQKIVMIHMILIIYIIQLSKIKNTLYVHILLFK